MTPDKPSFLVPGSAHSNSSKQRLGLPKSKINYHKQVSADLHFDKKIDEPSFLNVKNSNKNIPNKTPRKNFASFFKNMFASVNSK